MEPTPEAVKLLPADLQKGGTITMAADLNYPPTSFLADDNKTPVGYNVDIAHLLGETLGLTYHQECLLRQRDPGYRWRTATTSPPPTCHSDR